MNIKDMNISGLYALKPAFVRRLRGVEDELVRLGVRADALTLAAVAAAAAAGAAIVAGALLDAPLLWLAVPPLALVRIALNALDGSVARRTGTARPFGAALNETCDRLSDIAIVAPIAFVAGAPLALAATAAMLLASFTGVLAHAVGGVRDYGGPMGKADRMLVVGLAAAVAPVAPVAWTVAAAAIAAGCAVTAAARLTRLKATVSVDA